MILPLRFRTFWIGVTLLVAAIIVAGSLAPLRVMRVVTVWDKLQHAGSYCGLTLCCLGIVERRAYLWAAGAALLFGASMEVAQGTLTTTRVMDWHDLVANSTGIVAALACAYVGLGGWAQRVESLLRLR